MTRFSTGFRIATALLSLIAVVVSVLEHEDLVFQESRVPRAASADDQPLATQDNDTSRWLNTGSSWTKSGQDGCTEGTFRIEPHKLRAAPSSSSKILTGPTPRPLPSRAGWAARRGARKAPRTRPCLVGIVELRL